MLQLKKFICKIVLYFLFVCAVMIQTKAQSEIEIEKTLQKIFSPDEQTSIHAQALRRDIMRKLYDALQRQEIEDDLLDYKRSINSLARWDNLPGKRNLAALARGGYIKTIPDDENESDDKRSIAIMAKNGQLPNYQIEEGKRGIEALARNGELHNKREIVELINELYDKRNIGSLARNYNYPSYGKRYLGSLARSNNLNRFLEDKRNIASLARGSSKYSSKRNVAALLRQDNIHAPNDRDFDGIDHTDKPDNQDEQKRNLASIKAGYKQYKRAADATRTKRQVDYYELSDEYASPVYQNQNVYDYEELMKALTGEYPDTNKRFLGSVARSGWFRPGGMSRYTSRIDKRHIGSLARLGWLPALRSIRRFNRSGRSTTDCDRETSADGESENYSIAKNSISVDDKRFLLQPAVDKILLTKLLMRPKPQ